MATTKTNLYLETLPQGWKLYGKTCAGKLNALQDGWFIGFIQNANQIYIIILKFTDLKKPNNSEFTGVRAKK